MENKKINIFIEYDFSHRDMNDDLWPKNKKIIIKLFKKYVSIGVIPRINETISITDCKDKEQPWEFRIRYIGYRKSGMLFHLTENDWINQ